MKAMILAAGLGTRLHPVTIKIPKALVKIHDKTLLEITVKNLLRNGFEEIIINVHHFAEQIINYINKKNFNADIIISDESEYLLDTGGGLKKASWFFDDGNPFLVCNVDILTNMDLRSFYNHHTQSDSAASLVVRNRISGRYLLFDENNLLCGWKNIETNDEIKSLKRDPLNVLAFSGIQCINPGLLSYLPEVEKFSLIEFYLELMNVKKIGCYVEDEAFWLDVGKPGSIKLAEDNYDKIDY